MFWTKLQFLKPIIIIVKFVLELVFSSRKNIFYNFPYRIYNFMSKGFILENLKERFIKIIINYKMYFQYVSNSGLTWIVLWCLTSLSPIFQLYRGSQFCWWEKPEYPVKTTYLPQVTDKLDHIMLYRLSPPEWDSYSQLGDGYWFHSKSNYHTITITTAILKNFNELLIKIIINYKLHLPSNKMYLQYVKKSLKIPKG
jgi:hypothetical protein